MNAPALAVEGTSGRVAPALQLGPFFPLHEIIPELAVIIEGPALSVIPPPSTTPETSGSNGAKVIRVELRRRRIVGRESSSDGSEVVLEGGGTKQRQ